MKWTTRVTRAIAVRFNTRSGHTTTLCGHYVILVGGFCHTQAGRLVTRTEIFDINKNSWYSAMSDADVHGHTTCLVEDRLISIGGKIVDFSWNEHPSMKVTVLDLVSLGFGQVETVVASSQTKPINTRNHVAEYFELKREIVVYGGRPTDDEIRCENQLYVLKVDSLEWRKLAYQGRPPSSKNDHTSCADTKRSKMFVFSSSEPPELYVFDYRERIPCWTLIRTFGPCPMALSGGQIDFVNNDTLVLFGGYDRGYKNNLYRFDLRSLWWTECTPNPTKHQAYVIGKPPSARTNHTSVVCSGRIMYFGGEPHPYIKLDHILEFHC